MISEYFGDQADDCGTCDNCKERINSGKNKIANQIIENLPATLHELVLKLDCSAEELNAVIRELMHEEVITYNDQKYTVV